MSAINPLDRLWPKIDRTETCWLWTACRDRYGYGQTSLGGKFAQAHRAIYLLLVGPIPDDLTLDHLCRVPHCVNPDHLEPVTRQENIRRGKAASGELDKSHCRKGHEFTPENTYIRPGPKRIRDCRTCKRETMRRLRQKSPARSG